MRQGGRLGHPPLCESTFGPARRLAVCRREARCRHTGRCANSYPGPGLVRDPCQRAVPDNPVSGHHWGKRRRSSRGIQPGGQRAPVRIEAGHHSHVHCHHVRHIAPGFGRRPTLLRTVPQRLTLRSVFDSLFVFVLFLLFSGACLAPCFNRIDTRNLNRTPAGRLQFVHKWELAGGRGEAKCGKA
jgi:hypothetical protein